MRHSRRFLGLCGALFLLCVNLASAQLSEEWQVQYDLNRDNLNYGGIWNVLPTPDGGYLAVAYEYAMVGIDSLNHWHLLRLDEQGALLWERFYRLDRAARSAFLADDGGFQLIGWQWQLRVSATGDSLWAVNFGEVPGEFQAFGAASILPTPDGGFIAAGDGWVGTTLPTQAIIVKQSATGEREWYRAYGFQGVYNFFFNTIRLSNGEIVTGIHFSADLPPYGRSYLMRLSAAGDSLWAQAAEGLTGFIAPLQPITSGGFLAHVRGSSPPDIDRRYDDECNIVWEGHLWNSQVAHFGLIPFGPDHFLRFSQIYHGGVGDTLCFTYITANGDSLWGARIAAGHAFSSGRVFATPDGGVLTVMRHLNDEPFLHTITKYAPLNMAAPERAAERPAEFTLSAYPNPFNPSTRLSFTLPHAAQVRLTVFDIAGREVSSLYNGPAPMGTQDVTFNAADHPSGIYFARLETGGLTRTQKLMLLK